MLALSYGIPYVHNQVSKTPLSAPLRGHSDGVAPVPSLSPPLSERKGNQSRTNRLRVLVTEIRHGR